jgi:hypothetical protein
MTQTVTLTDPNQLTGFFAGIADDFARIDCEPYLFSELDYIADQEQSYFAASAGPDGSPWKANAPRTIKQKGHSIILRGKRGERPNNIKPTKRRPGVSFSRQQNTSQFRLARSLTLKSHQSFDDAIREAVATDSGGKLRFGTFVPYSIFNDQGTERIPARPHIGFTDKYLDQATNRVLDFTIQQLAK